MLPLTIRTEFGTPRFLVVNLMGQQTSVALRPRLVTLDAGVNAAIGLLIVTSAEDLAKRATATTARSDR